MHNKNISSRLLISSLVSCSNLRVFGHFFHLLFSFWNGNRNHIGAGQSYIPGRYWVNNLTHVHTEKDTDRSVELTP